MTKKEKILLIGSIIMIVAAVGILLIKRNPDPANTVKIELSAVRQPNNGWGYDIRVGEKFYIHQDHIPGITGYKQFISKEEALKIGQLVVQKLKEKQAPSVSEQELTRMNIHY